MDIYKQKYEQALENIKKIKKANKDNKELVDFIEYQYPELKESEDEKIRYYLIDFVKINDGVNIPPDYAKKALAWLEKQDMKESKKTSIWKHWKDGIAGNGEGKLIYLIKNGNDYSLSSCLGYECDYILLSDLDKLMLEEKHDGQKPADKVEPKFKAGDFIADGRRVLLVLANKEERNLGETYSTYCEGLALDVYGEVLVDIKNFSSYRFATDIERANFVHDLKVGTKINYKTTEWSEEEWQIIKDSACFILSCVNTVDTKEEEERLEKLADKLQNLRPQPKQKWSEEDEKILEIVTSVLQVNFEPEERFSGYEEYMNVDLINWLKSLKKRMKGE